MSISVRRVSAIFLKQLSDFYRNPNIMISAVLAPVFAILYMYLMPSMLGEGADFLTAYVLGLTMIMNMVMVGFMMMTYMIAEEKEKNTLRVLILSGVRPPEFVLGNGMCTILVGFVMHILLFFICGASLAALPLYALCGLLCLVAGAFLGATVGVLSKNQMTASITAVPILLVLMILPIFSGVNATLGKVASVLFTTAAKDITSHLLVVEEGAGVMWTQWLIILANIVVFALVFALAYRRNRKDD